MIRAIAARRHITATGRRRPGAASSHCTRLRQLPDDRTPPSRPLPSPAAAPAPSGRTSGRPPATSPCTRPAPRRAAAHPHIPRHSVQPRTLPRLRWCGPPSPAGSPHRDLRPSPRASSFRKNSKFRSSSFGTMSCRSPYSSKLPHAPSPGSGRGAGREEVHAARPALPSSLPPAKRGRRRTVRGRRWPRPGRARAGGSIMSVTGTVGMLPFRPIHAGRRRPTRTRPCSSRRRGCPCPSTSSTRTSIALLGQVAGERRPGRAEVGRLHDHRLELVEPAAGLGHVRRARRKPRRQHARDRSSGRARPRR